MLSSYIATAFRFGLASKHSSHALLRKTTCVIALGRRRFSGWVKGGTWTTKETSWRMRYRYTLAVFKTLGIAALPSHKSAWHFVPNQTWNINIPYWIGSRRTRPANPVLRGNYTGVFRCIWFKFNTHRCASIVGRNADNPTKARVPSVSTYPKIYMYNVCSLYNNQVVCAARGGYTSIAQTKEMAWCVFKEVGRCAQKDS